ncbi:MAG: hypothetical protein Q4D06_09300, partial [Coriobacteriia bacterium]|nr:hypothetical protein [Coriobacteriia bacterium]
GGGRSVVKREKKAEQKAAAQKAADKKKADAKKPAEKGGVSDPVSSTPKRTWVEPVYKTVHHKEQGHYETQTQKVQKVKCNCGKLFDTSSAWKAHQDAFLKYMRENVDPNYTCKGDHLSHYVTVEESKQVYVVDKEAYDEKVLVKKGYWK